ncbi:NAD-dependent_histone deacetylase Sir2 [Hexamita inflata]|uniref:NAD-dependent histone deacetylase Sir2 n=1 Tax=Hexamita inflata TaxID=28002 RepID=A0AA86U6K1_9EUKA|nr:NAD-dependent histone deacetylase Sir2 [Hexamita inflata]
MSSPFEVLALTGAPLHLLQNNEQIMQQLAKKCISRNIQFLAQDKEMYFSESSSDNQEMPPDPELYNSFRNNCESINVDLSTQLRDLGLQIPPDTFSNKALSRFCDQIYNELLLCRYSRFRIRQLSKPLNAVQLFRHSKRIVFLIGAGVSVASGIPDFRSKNGIYQNLQRYNLLKPTDMFDLEFFQKNPIPFYKFCPEIVPQEKYKPTFTHKFIAKLSNQNKTQRIYTQNIDCLESRAGIDHNIIVNCHGSFENATCMKCEHQVSIEQYGPVIQMGKIPVCGFCESQLEKGQIIEYELNAKNVPQHVYKPNIVFFGEKLPDGFLDYIDLDVRSADLFVVVGSSLKVKPISGLLGRMPRHVPQILINREHISGIQHQFDVELLGNSDSVFGLIAHELGWDDLIEEHNSKLDSLNAALKMQYETDNQQYEIYQNKLLNIQTKIEEIEWQERYQDQRSQELQNMIAVEKQLIENCIIKPQLHQYAKINPKDITTRPSTVVNMQHVHKVYDPNIYVRDSWKNRRKGEKFIQNESDDDQ